MSYNSPTSSVYSFATGTSGPSRTSFKGSDFSYNMGDHRPTSKWYHL